MNLFHFLQSNARWLGAGALLMFLSSFGQTFFISIFADEILDEFNLTPGSWGQIYGLGTLISAAIMVRAGAFADTMRTRTLGIIVLAGLSLSCVAMATNTMGAALIMIVLFLRLFGQGMSTHLAAVAMSRWYVAARGRALAISALGFTVGELIFPIGLVALLDVVNWRFLWIGAASIALLGIPVLLWLLSEERHPQNTPEDRQHLGMNAAHWTRRDMVRHPLFWCLVPAILGPSAFNTAFFFQQVSYAREIDWTHIQLVSLFPLYTALSVGAMILSGIALDRFGVARLMPFYQLPMGLAFLCFAYGSSLVSVGAGLILLAMSAGGNATLPNAFWAEFYGTRHLGSIKALTAAVMVLGSAIGPAITGSFVDLGVGLRVQYVWVFVFFLGATALMYFAIRRYQRTLVRL